MGYQNTITDALHETDFIDQLIRGLGVFQFADATECPTQMEMWDNLTQKIANLYSASNYITAKIFKFIDKIKNE